MKKLTQKSKYNNYQCALVRIYFISGLLLFLVSGAFAIFSVMQYLNYIMFLNYVQSLPPGHSTPLHLGLEYSIYSAIIGTIFFSVGTALLIKEKKTNYKLVIIFVIIIVISILILPTFNSESYSGKKFVDVKIEGLRETYKVGEQIIFFVNLEGSGQCVPPRIIIKSTMDQSEIWTNEDSLLSGITCYPNNVNIEFPAGKEKPIIINQSGKYVILIPFYNKTVEKEFTVVQ